MKNLKFMLVMLITAFIFSFPCHGTNLNTIEFEPMYKLEGEDYLLGDMVPIQSPKFVMLDKNKVVFEFNLGQHYLQEMLTATVQWKYCCDDTVVTLKLTLVN